MESVLDGLSAPWTDVCPSPSTNLPCPSAMKMTAGKPCSLTLTAASVPGIEAFATTAPAASHQVGELAHRRAEAAGSLESITSAASRLNRPVPLTNIPPEPAQPPKSCCSFALRRVQRREELFDAGAAERGEHGRGGERGDAVQQRKRARKVGADVADAGGEPRASRAARRAPRRLPGRTAASSRSTEWTSPCSEIELAVGVTDSDADCAPAKSWPSSDDALAGCAARAVNALRQRFGLDVGACDRVRGRLGVAGGGCHRGASQRGVDHALHARFAADHREVLDDALGGSVGGHLVGDAPVARRVRLLFVCPLFRNERASPTSEVSSTIAPWAPSGAEGARARARTRRPPEPPSSSAWIELALWGSLLGVQRGDEHAGAVRRPTARCRA